MENKSAGPADSRAERNIDVLFGLIEAHYCAIAALIRSHPNPDGFEAHFDMHLAGARAQLLGSDRSDLAIAALEDHSAELKGHLLGSQTLDGVAHRTWWDLKARLKPEE